MRAGGIAALVLATTSTGAIAQSSDVTALREELTEARAEIAAQRTRLDLQEARLQALEARLASTAPAEGVSTAQASGGIQRAPIERVGEAPSDFDRPPEVAVLGDQGSVVTRAGQLTGELQFEYARSDRNRAIFRGIEIPEAVLIGVFDINESRQDVLTAAATLRYGVSDRFEVGVRLPYVYRNDFSIRAPIPGSVPDEEAATIDNSSKGNGIGDLELSMRYQLTNARRGLPFLIANLQAVIPTGTDPFGVPRDALGRALRSATGAGFYGISPSITAILPSDPVVLFGTLGYTFNLSNDVNTIIPPVIVEHVDPGDAIAASAGIGISFNERTTINLGYAHTWAFGTLTRTRPLEPDNINPDVVTTTTSRDLQIGRFLFGMTYRVSERASVNWSVEVGATDDAADVRTILRIPFVLLTGE